MSIRNVEEGRKRQQQQREARRNREAEARPDAAHRAIVFLLRAAKENNPDISEEAEHHLNTLDRELANTAKIAELEKNPAPNADDDSAEPEAPAAAPDTAKEIRRSRRFQRG